MSYNVCNVLETEKKNLLISLPHRCYELIPIIFLFRRLQGRSPQGKSGFRSMTETHGHNI